MKYQEWYDEYNKNIMDVFSDWKKSMHDNNIYESDEENPKRNVFITDGIVDAETWFNSDVRPLFVLKEAYDSSDNISEEWDEVDWVRKAKHDKISGTNKTWQTLCAWAHDIVEAPYQGHYTGELYWDDTILKRIAVINIKKYGGQQKSNYKDLERHAKEYAELIYRQIELIHPTVIICGYTGWILDIVWAEITDNKLRNAGNGRIHDISIDGIDAVLIDFWHPSCINGYSKDWDDDMRAYHTIV